MNRRPLTRRSVLGGLAAATLAPLALTQAAAYAVGVPPAGTADALDGEGAATAAGAGLRQMRGMWIASVANINWPSRTGLTPEEQRKEFVSWLDYAASHRLNAVFVQIRPTADAFWPSRFEPWSQYLTGVQGRDPGYDPLAFMVEAAHARGLAFHAWFNPYRVSMQPDPAKLVPEHPVRRHPEWGVAYGGKLYYNPGLPEVRAFVEDAIMDAVTRYDIDGVHFDDYFYPYPVAGQEFDDAAAYARYGSGFPDRAAWRRNNVDLLIKEMGERIRAARPEVQWGVSPFGIWRNASTDPLGSATSGSQSYDNQHADTRGWVKKGWLDYIAPQVYWNIGLPVADYAVLAPWWAQVVAGTGTQLWIGQAAYKVGVAGQPAAWQDPAELSRHLTLNRDHPQIGGDIYYSAGDLRADRLGSTTRLLADHYTSPALPPLLPRLAAGAAPRRPVLTRVRRTADGVELDFHATGHAEPRLYAIYRLEPGADTRREMAADQAGEAPEGGDDLALTADAGGEEALEKDGRAWRLVAVVPGGHRAAYTDPEGRRGSRYRVTALDKAARQSAPSRSHRSH
ncbi:glycoside hydrolase family 10 protein [Sphaerisporangium fuscum]|uniref:glycoside hydrolase family 10 protein n=1 Tax=Sphaerisporangium fuscum TaxID=2835868 RepID=UPI001BDD788E|nr:family 10 glycosylhydrolase [Sphaerisporangium fuscum]